MSGRKLLCIPLEKHRLFAFALQELDRLAHDPSAPAGMRKACDNLRSELDEHVFDEFKNLPEQERFDVYYTAPKDFLEHECDLQHGLRVLDELIAALEAADPQGKALVHARTLRRKADGLAVRQEARARREAR